MNLALLSLLFFTLVVKVYKQLKTKKAVRARTPPPRQCCSPGGSTIFGFAAISLIESNGNENFKVIQNPGFLPDHPQN